MKVRFTERGAKAVTLNRKPVHEPGDVVEMPDGRARLFIQCVYVEPVKDEPTLEENLEDGGTDTDQDGTDDDSGTEKPEPTAKEIRAWAKENDVDCPARGALPESVREAYDAAH